MPAFTFEIGEGGRLDVELIPIGVRCICNALQFLRMLPGEPEPPRETVTMSRFVGVRARRGGLLHTVIPLGAHVRQGEVLAHVYSVYGDELETIRAPMDGTFVRMTTFPSVAAGERVITLGV